MTCCKTSKRRSLELSALDLRTINGKRRLEPPRRKGCGRLAAVRNERPSATGVLRGATRCRHLRGVPGKWQAAMLKAEGNRPKLRDRRQRPLVERSSKPSVVLDVLRDQLLDVTAQTKATLTVTALARPSIAPGADLRPFRRGPHAGDGRRRPQARERGSASAGRCVGRSVESHG